jgi:hypothetical protein
VRVDRKVFTEHQRVGIRVVASRTKARSRQAHPFSCCRSSSGRPRLRRSRSAKLSTASSTAAHMTAQGSSREARPLQFRRQSAGPRSSVTVSTRHPVGAGVAAMARRERQRIGLPPSPNARCAEVGRHSVSATSPEPTTVADSQRLRVLIWSGIGYLSPPELTKECFGR